jgi:hypothetical protein
MFPVRALNVPLSGVFQQVVQTLINTAERLVEA